MHAADTGTSHARPAGVPADGWAGAWRRWRERLPGRCALCHAWPARAVCADCAARFAPALPRCRRCALAVPDGVAVCGACLRAPPPLDACVAACDYAWPWPEQVGRFKFQGESGWAGPLAALMRAAPGAAGLLAQADWVLPVPLAPRRLAWRGFNQSLELARHLAPPGRLQARWLLRTRETPPQASLPRHQRLANLKDAFTLDAAVADRLGGARMLLVDDVMTTGSSLHAAAAVLRNAGAAWVGALVLARTAAPHEG